MIFISGIHGVGKSYFCESVKIALGVDTYSASTLIAERKKVEFFQDKLIPDIDDNQQYLLSAIQDLNVINPLYLLDGHFCLLNAQGQITRIPHETFTSLNPDAIILLTEDPDVVACRRRSRDGIQHNAENIRLFQDEEITYAKEVSERLDVTLWISTGSADMADTLGFLQSTMRRIENARKISTEKV